MSLTGIPDRLTPSVPLELSFAAQPVATGRKYATLYGHMAATPGTGTPFQVYTVINVGDPAAAQAEVNALAGAGSQIGNMAQAFVKANLLTGVFPAFRVVLMPFGELHFGPNSEAILNTTLLRSDLLVSCYPSGDATNKATLLALCALISGIDRDLSGQFGSFVQLASILPLATQLAFADNSRYLMEEALPDSNNALVPITGSVTVGSNIVSTITQAPISITGSVTSSSTMITGITSTAGVYPGAALSGTGIAVGAVVQIITATTIQMSLAATATGASESISVTNLPTAGIYPGAQLSGTGIPAGAIVQSVAASTVTMNVNASATGASEAINAQNVVSQAPEIIAAACAAVKLASAFPYNPLNGVVVNGLLPPQKISDWIALDPNGASEAALTAGLSPLRVLPGGTVGFVRTRTTYNLVEVGVPATSYFDWQDLVTMNDFREDCFLITQQPPFNNNPGGTKASAQIAAKLKDEILREAQDYEDEGAFQGVKTLAPLFQVVPSNTSRGRFDFVVPVNVLPGLMVIAGNIQAQSTLGNFTL